MARDRLGDGLSAEMFTVGLSQIFGITQVPGQLEMYIRRVDGGSCEIGGPSLTWGNGFLLQPNVPFSITNAGPTYVAATSATTTISILRTLSDRALGG